MYWHNLLYHTGSLLLFYLACYAVFNYALYTFGQGCFLTAFSSSGGLKMPRAALLWQPSVKHLPISPLFGPMARLILNTHLLRKRTAYNGVAASVDAHRV